MPIINGVVASEYLVTTASPGLSSARNSIGYQVAEIVRDTHSSARWFEAAAVPDGTTHTADRMGTGGGAFSIDAGNDDWGAWVQILGSSDTPAQTGRVYFDPHEVIIENTERAATYLIQIGRGESGAAALAAGTYTEFPYSATVQKDTGVINVETGRAPAGSLVWARCICPGENTATISFYIGIHEYEG